MINISLMVNNFEKHTRRKGLEDASTTHFAVIGTSRARCEFLWFLLSGFLADESKFSLFCEYCNSKRLNVESWNFHTM